MAELIDDAQGRRHRGPRHPDLRLLGQPELRLFRRARRQRLQLPPKINGYQVTNTVTVRVRELDTLGAVLDKAVTVGANTINGVSFSVADPSELYDEARKAAFADARDKAELYADAAGVELGDIALDLREPELRAQPQPYMHAGRWPPMPVRPKRRAVPIASAAN